MDIRETILGARAQLQQNITKGFVDNDIEKGGEGSRGGNIIGHTKSGKAIYSSPNAKHEKTYTSKDHEDAAYAHLDKQSEHDKLASKHKDDANKSSFHSNKSEIHSREYDRHMSSKNHKSKTEDIKKSEEDDFEKAINRQVGDVHPNGKWVWTQLPSGKYDWRVITAKKQQAAAKAPEKKEDSSVDLIHLVKDLNDSTYGKGMHKNGQMHDGYKLGSKNSSGEIWMKNPHNPDKGVWNSEDEVRKHHRNVLMTQFRMKLGKHPDEVYKNFTNKKEDSAKQAPAQKVQTDSIAALESKVPGHLIMKERKEYMDAKLHLEDWEKEKITPQNKSGYDAAQKSLAEAAKKYREALNAKLQSKK